MLYETIAMTTVCSVAEDRCFEAGRAIVLVPAIALSGAITIASTSLAPTVPQRGGLILIVAVAIDGYSRRNVFASAK